MHAYIVQKRSGLVGIPFC